MWGRGQDCLLVAMHHRALPGLKGRHLDFGRSGRVLWHSWEGDLFTLSPGEDQEEIIRFRWSPFGPFVMCEDSKLCPVPTFNDWWQLVSGVLRPCSQESARTSESSGALHGV